MVRIAFAESQSSPANITSTTNSMIVYPNPTTGIITMRFDQPSSGNCKVVLTDMKGRIVLEKTIYVFKGENLRRLNLSNVTNGSYLLQIQTSAGENVIKVVKE